MLERADIERKRHGHSSARQLGRISSTSVLKSHCNPPVWLYGLEKCVVLWLVEVAVSIKCEQGSRIGQVETCIRCILMPDVHLSWI